MALNRIGGWDQMFRSFRENALAFDGSLPAQEEQEGSRTQGKRRQRTLDADLLTLRAAATRLGMDRNTTLKRLIATGALKTVLVDGKRRVPRSEILRVEAEGTQPSKKSSNVGRKQQRRSAVGRAAAAEVRKFKVRKG